MEGESVRKKRVRFRDDAGCGSLHEKLFTVPHREDFSEEEVADMFFTRSDYHSCRSTAKVISKESEKFGYSKSLDSVYDEKNKASQDSLNLWAASGHSRRGLERWANRRHGEKRQQDQFNVIMTVLREQDDMLANKGRVSDEALRKISHRATRVSRHFARMMGKADSYAVAVGLKGDDDGSLCTAMTLMTTQSEDDPLRSSRNGSLDSQSIPSPMPDDESVNISLPSYGSISDSSHRSDRSSHRLRRFGFGRKKPKSAVPRIA